MEGILTHCMLTAIRWYNHNK